MDAGNEGSRYVFKPLDRVLRLGSERQVVRTEDELVGGALENAPRLAALHGKGNCRHRRIPPVSFSSSQVANVSPPPLRPSSFLFPDALSRRRETSTVHGDGARTAHTRSCNQAALVAGEGARADGGRRSSRRCRCCAALAIGHTSVSTFDRLHLRIRIRRPNWRRSAVISRWRRRGRWRWRTHTTRRRDSRRRVG
jgi:hypothetical protein